MKHVRIMFSVFRDRFRQLRTNWLVSAAHRSIVVFSLLSLILLAIQWRRLPPAVPLWYSRPWGEEQLAHPLWLLLLPVSGVAWHAINVLISVFLLADYPLFVRILMGTSFLVNGLLFVAITVIISLVA